MKRFPVFHASAGFRYSARQAGAADIFLVSAAAAAVPVGTAIFSGSGRDHRKSAEGTPSKIFSFSTGFSTGALGTRVLIPFHATAGTDIAAG